MAKNSVGRDIPEYIGNRKLIPYMGPFEKEPDSIIKVNKRQSKILPGESKIKSTIKDAIISSGLKDGMTISFHHHFREGDKVIGLVLTIIKELGIKNLRFAPSAVINIKNPSIVDFVKDGTISRIEASGIRGQLGDAVIEGFMDEPVVLRTHGSRPRAIESGELSIDIAFIAASASDDYGNANGFSGPNACGSLGYAMIDAKSAEKVIVITDTLVDFPCVPASISQHEVDYVVVVDEIGDSASIGKGAARVTKNPRDLLIAKNTANVIANCGYFNDGFTFLTGVGATSIACIQFLREKMIEKNIKAGAAIGGIPAAVVKLHEEGLVKVVEAVQCFDAESAKALGQSNTICECDNNVYSNVHNKGNMVNKVDIGILAALEVDTDFNVNILTGSSGEMLGGLGGGPDVAAGAQVSIVTIPLFRGRTPSIVKKVFTLCTPGETVALVVTELGVSINPNHKNYEFLKENLSKSNIKIIPIEELQQMAEEITGTPKPIECTDKVVAVVEYRDGTVIDVIRQIKK